MKKSLVYILLLLIIPMGLFAQPKTVGTTGADYPTLKAAFDAINAGTLTGAVTLQIIANTTETAPAALNASGGSSNYTSVLIYPIVSGITISGNLNAPLIKLYGADNVTIDGSVGHTGASKDLIIENTNTSATGGTSTIQFINGATNNTVKYCTLKGSAPVAASGIIFFSTAGTSGNNGNIIDNNDITNSVSAIRSRNAIYSEGTVAPLENSGNTISNNNIFDFLNSGLASNGIFISLNSTGWTVTGNSFYETTSFVPNASVQYYAIRVNNTGGNYTISDNFIGGNTSACGGPPWTKTNAFNNVFYGIHLTAGTGTVNNIQNNTIKNFDWSNSSNGNWIGIHIARGDANVGTVTGNTIGAATGEGSILLTGKTNGNTVYGIYITSPGNVNCMNNQIGAVKIANADANGSIFYGIYKFAVAGTTTISNNLIGSQSTANSIYASSPSTGYAQTLRGIYNTGTGTCIISGNTIANLTNGTTNTINTCSVAGIDFAGSTDANTASGNFINSLAINSPSGFIYGIRSHTGSCTYSNNIIALGGDLPATIYGIFETGLTGTNNNLYFNTIDISGNPASGTNKSYALYSAVNTNTRDLRNNILVNARSTNGGTNLHYAAYVAATGGTITCDYNDYWVSGTGGILGYFGTNVTTLPIVTGQDVSSQSVDPLFALAGGTSAENYLPSASTILAASGTGILTDYEGTIRDLTFPSMGAYEIKLLVKVAVYKSSVFQAAYFTLKEAFDAFNTGTHSAGSFEIRINGSTF